MKKNVLLLLTFLLPFFSFQLNSQVFRFDLESPNIPDAKFKVVVYPKLVQISDGDELIGSFSYNSFCATQNGVILAEGGDKGFLSSADEQFFLDVSEGKYGHSISFYKGFPVGYAMITEGKDFAIVCNPTNPDKFNNELNSLTEYILKNNKQTTPSTTKIEPYQSTAVRDIRKKKDLTFDDIFYLGRENTTLKEFKRYYPFTHGSIDLGLSHTLYGHPVSNFLFSKDYKDFWDCSCYVYFGESNSKSALEEANKFMQDIYAYLIKRGRNVTMTMGGNSSYPDCYLLKFNEGQVREIAVTKGGLYYKRNGEPGWGIVIHMRYSYK